MCVTQTANERCRPLADIATWEQTLRISSLYPARRIPQGMILIGGAFMALALAMAIGHFGFGVPVYNRDTDQGSSDLAVAILALAFGGIGVVMAVMGLAALRAARRHHSKRTSKANGS